MLSEVAHPLLRFIIYIFEEEDDLKAKIGSPYERLKDKKPSFSSSLVADCNEFRCKFVLIIQLFILFFFFIRFIKLPTFARAQSTEFGSWNDHMLIM